MVIVKISVSIRMPQIIHSEIINLLANDVNIGYTIMPSGKRY